MYAYEFVSPANRFMNMMERVFRNNPSSVVPVFALHFAIIVGIIVFGVVVGGALKTLSLMVAIILFGLGTLFLSYAALDSHFD